MATYLGKSPARLAIITDDTITSSKILDNTITSADILNATITGADLASDIAITTTGALVSNGLTVDTNTLHVDATNNRVGIGTTSPSKSLHIASGNDVKFEGQLSMSDNQLIKMGAGEDFAFYHDTTVGNVIKSSTSDMDIIIKGNDGGSEINALTFDMSDLGKAIFNGSINVGDGHVVGWGDNSYRIEGKDDGTNARLGFVTGSSERMRISSTGKVGIGTTSPTQKLTIADTSVAQIHIHSALPSVRFSSDTGGGNDATRSFVGMATGNNHFVNGSIANDFVVRGTLGNKLLFGGGSTVYGCFSNAGHFQVDAFFNVDATNNRVGIGTVSPTQALTIAGGDNAKLAFIGGGVQSLYFNDTDTSLAGYFHYDHSADQFRMNTSGCFAFTGGCVGIGTTTPASEFHVHASGSSTVNMYLTNDTTGSTSGNGLEIGYTTGSNTAFFLSLIHI